jgi:hypothetical protein
VGLRVGGREGAGVGLFVGLLLGLRVGAESFGVGAGVVGIRVVGAGVVGAGVVGKTHCAGFSSESALTSNFQMQPRLQFLGVLLAV